MYEYIYVHTPFENTDENNGNCFGKFNIDLEIKNFTGYKELKYNIDNLAKNIIKKYNLFGVINKYLNIIFRVLDELSRQYGWSYFVVLTGEIDPDDGSEEVVIEIMLSGSIDSEFKMALWREIEELVSKIEDNLPDNEKELSLEHIAIRVI